MVALAILHLKPDLNETHWFGFEFELLCLGQYTNSILRNSPKCSVVQVSHLSGVMFNLYCCEIPRLPSSMSINYDGKESVATTPSRWAI